MLTSSKELTIRVFILAIFLTVLLAVSNAFLALKLGLLTSASIPAAILSMGILRWFRKPSLLEHNAVQTAASAGEAVAGGIVYTIPALVIIGYWHEFAYWTNFFIAATGGLLGVLFSVPLRKILVHDKSLMFPEGRAIAEVLKTTKEQSSARDLTLGACLGGGLTLGQLGLKWLATQWSYWILLPKTVLGISIGFSPTMIGAGYLVGREMAWSIMIGALLSWGIGLPIAAYFNVNWSHDLSAQAVVSLVWNQDMRYLGIGAMLMAGLWTLKSIMRPLIKTLRHSIWSKAFPGNSRVEEQDIPLRYLIMGIILVTIMIGTLFFEILPMSGWGIWLAALFYVLIVGAFFSIITAYFSAMVGVSATPGSAVLITGILLAGILVQTVLRLTMPLPWDSIQMQAAEAIVIILCSVVMGVASIALDNIQDLKVGQLVGATPWKQQLMLMLGVVVSALIIPPVMQVLYHVYGIAGVMPHSGMDVTQSMPAPVAALLAMLTRTVFESTMPWNKMLLGAGFIGILIILNQVLIARHKKIISILGVAIGMYLPMTTSFPLFLGGMFSSQQQKGAIFSSGLVAGAAIMEVILAVVIAVSNRPEILAWTSPGFEPYSIILSILVLIGLGRYFLRIKNSA